MSGLIYLEPRDNPEYFFRQLIHEINTNFSASTSGGGGGSLIQNGLNTYTGGTSTAQTINVSALTIDNIFVSGNSTFNSISAITYYSGVTPLETIINSIITGSTGSSQNLSQILSNGNTTGGQSIKSDNLANIFLVDNTGINLSSSTPFYTSNFKVEGSQIVLSNNNLIDITSPQTNINGQFSLTSLSANTLIYLDSNKFLKSIFLGTNLTLSGNVLDVTDGTSNTFTGGTVNGPTNFTSGLTANTFSTDALNITGTFKYIDGNQETGKILTTDSLGNATWQPPSVLGTLAYFLTSSANTIPTYYQAVNQIVTSSIQTISNSSVVDGQLLASFSTSPNSPSLAYLPAGIVTLHIHAANTNSGELTTLFFNIYKRTTGGTENILGSSSNTDTVPPVNGTLYTDVTITGVTANTTDILVVKVYANVIGGGTAPDISLYLADGTASRFEIPTFAVNSSDFIPYTGATNNVNLGVYNITANSINSTNDLTSNTISATTYYNLPTFTGGTVTGPTNFTGGLTASTISATTYYGDGSNLTGITMPTAAPAINLFNYYNNI
jgi:hypothetical protein